MITTLVLLIFAHLIGDFVLQPTSWVRAKEQKKLLAYQFYLHILVHGLLVWLLLGKASDWQLPLAVMLLHTLIDAFKISLQKDYNRTWWFIYDQFLHLISLVAVWVIWYQVEYQLIEVISHPILILYVTAIILLTLVCGILVQSILQPLSKHLEPVEAMSLKNAGKYIGILERLFVFTFVVTNNWGAIGFLLAAKSVFRFGDLRESRDRKLTEYILIGTLISFALGVAIALLVVYLQPILLQEIH